MSQENLEIVRRVFAEYEHGNFQATEPFDPNFRVRWLDAVGAEAETAGPQQAGEFLKGWFEVQKDVSLSAERLIDAGDRVVAIAVWRGIGKASGAATEWRHGQVWTLRDAKITSIVGYKDWADALKAVGLAE